MLGHFPSGRAARARIAVVAALSASLLGAAVTAPAPSAASSSDPQVLNHRKTQVGHQITSSQGDLDEISARLLRAQGRLDAATGQLADAQATLAGLQAQVHQAAVKDQQLQQRLDDAIQRLSDARADLARGRASLADQRAEVTAYAISRSQVGIGQLSTLNLLVNAHSTQAAISQVQSANSVVDKQVSDLQRLRANQVLLALTGDRIQTATQQVAAARAEAAADLAAKRRLESAAAAAEASVADRVAALQAEQGKLTSAKAAELAQIQSMERVREQLTTRLKHIAEVRAARARREAAQRAAAQRAAAQRAAAQQAASSAASSSGSSTGSSSTSLSSTATDGGFLSWPVTNSYITSPYGMRMHPILHVWKLHDGTDFHAMCGTPVHAAASGRVLSEYYAGGYGNQLVIDHGMVNGVSLATSYNHLTSFVVHTGSYVQRGQLIAYSGTTGYSTACHLHFMVYVNGSTVDPMTWL